MVYGSEISQKTSCIEPLGYVIHIDTSVTMWHIFSSSNPTMLPRSDRSLRTLTSTRVAVGLLAVVLGVSPGHALYRWTPSAVRISSGGTHSNSWGRSWGYYVAFSSKENLDPTKSTGGTRQIFLFSVLDYACQNGRPELRSADETTPPCPATPQPYIRQITSGPGDADNPTVSADGASIAFDADGAYGGGNGLGVGRRQVFLWTAGQSGQTIRITDAPDGDSTGPTLSGGGGNLAFESTASLLGQTPGVKQIFLYNRANQKLDQITYGEGPSTRPMFNKIGTHMSFQSTANLIGDASDSGVSQIFIYDRSEGGTGPGVLHQLTDGNGDSRNPYLEEKTPGRVFFDSTATDLPGTPGGPGRQVYAVPTSSGDFPAVEQITIGVGNCFYPAVEPSGERAVFICDGDKLANGTSGNRLFALEMSSLGRTLYQITGRGHVDGPISASVGTWFLTAATDNDMAGTGNCGTNLYIADYWTGHYYEAGHARLAVTLPGFKPGEPFPGSSNGGCDDGNLCTNDVCSNGLTCSHTTASDGSQCGSGDVCSGLPICQAGQCQKQAGLSCDDGDPCTTNRCNPNTAACEYPAIPPAQGGVQCQQQQVNQPVLPAKVSRIRSRLDAAVSQALTRPKPAGQLRSARKAQVLAQRLAQAATKSGTGIDQAVLDQLLDSIQKLIRVLNDLIPLIRQLLGK